MAQPVFRNTSPLPLESQDYKPLKRVAYTIALVGITALLLGILWSQGVVLHSVLLQEKVWIPFIVTGSVLTLIAIGILYKLHTEDKTRAFASQSFQTMDPVGSIPWAAVGSSPHQALLGDFTTSTQGKKKWVEQQLDSQNLPLM